MAEEYDRLRSRIESVVAETWQRSDFDWGIDQLTALGQFFGYFTHPAMAECLALQQLHVSFFNVHLGRTSSALAHGHLALRLFEDVARSRPKAVAGVIEALGAIAHGHLLARASHQALTVIQQMERLHRQHRVPMLPESFRKKGVAYLQLSGTHEGEARSAFVEAARVPASGADPLEYQMMSQRHLNLLTVNVDGAQALAQDAGQTYGLSSLQRSMCMHWSAAVALATDSPTLQQEAAVVLQHNAVLAQTFGHQATITYLLNKTNDLGVPLRFRREWVRLALYSNAFRND